MRSPQILKNASRHLISALILLTFGILALGSAETDRETSEAQATNPVATLSADRLAEEYSQNEVRADRRYKDKVVVVDGVLQRIGKDITDNAYIVIGGQGFLDGVQCIFTSGEEGAVAELSVGQHVTVKGEVAGKAIGNVLMRKCRLQ